MVLFARYSQRLHRAESLFGLLAPLLHRPWLALQ